MKYLKTYENINTQVGDYVIIKSWLTDINAARFLNNTIGQIDRFIGPDVSIKYDKELIKKANLYFANNRIIIHSTQIKYWSKSKEELEMMLIIMKYNL